MIKKNLAKFLRDSDTVRDYVDDRIFPGRARLGQKMPYVILTKFPGQTFNDLAGEADYVRSIVEVAVYTKSNSTLAADISEAIRNRLSGYMGPAGDAVIKGCSLEFPAQDFVISPDDGSDDWTFVSTADYSIIYEQSFATHT